AKRIGAALLRRTEHGGNRVATTEERLERRLAEILLPDDGDPHATTSRNCGAIGSPACTPAPAWQLWCGKGWEGTMAFDEQTAVEEFWAARARGEYFPAAWFDRLTLDEAYRIQSGMIARRVAAGERQIGLEGGVTPPGVPQQVGVPEPGVGCILDRPASGPGFPPREPVPAGVRAGRVP